MVTRKKIDLEYKYDREVIGKDRDTKEPVLSLLACLTQAPSKNRLGFNS